jgi:hypothetical protein
MQRTLHGALALWFVIATSMAQGCAAPAQSANQNSTAGTNFAGTEQSQFSHHAKGSSGIPDVRNYVPDAGASTALTDHLKQHRLPLVGAQVLRNPNDGSRAVVLYGFVGSDLGKSAAQRQAEDYVNDPSVEVDNRIRVNPDLLTARGSPSVPPPNASYDPYAQANVNNPATANTPAMPGVQSYVDQQNQSAQVQQYQQQNSMSGSMSSMLPLIALMGLLSMSSGGGSFSTGPSMGSSPFGYPSSPYGGSPYGGLPSPYGGSPYSPYGYSPGMPPSSFGSPGYGYGSSGGVTPFGSLPGSPYFGAP